MHDLCTIYFAAIEVSVNDRLLVAAHMLCRLTPQQPQSLSSHTRQAALQTLASALHRPHGMHAAGLLLD